MRFALCVLVCAIGTSPPAPSLAQVAEADRPAVYTLPHELAPDVWAERQGSVGKAVGIGALLGGVGFLAGGAAGFAISRDCTSDEFCQVIGAFYGAAIGGTSGMALGVHLGNDRRGSFALDVLTGAAVWGLGIGIAAATDWNEPVTWTAFIGVPIGQLAATVAVEQAVGRSRGPR